MQNVALKRMASVRALRESTVHSFTVSAFCARRCRAACVREALYLRPIVKATHVCHVTMLSISCYHATPAMPRSRRLFADLQPFSMPEHPGARSHALG